MKDPHDKKTVDGFAHLVTLLEQAQADAQPGEAPRVPLSDLKQLADALEAQEKPKKGGGRKPLGERALTPAEKQKAYRDRLKLKKLQEQVRAAEIRAGIEPPPKTHQMAEKTTVTITLDGPCIKALAQYMETKKAYAMVGPRDPGFAALHKQMLAAEGDLGHAVARQIECERKIPNAH